MKVSLNALALLIILFVGCNGGSSKSSPTVSSVTPATGTVGTIVLISGTGFEHTPTVVFRPSSGGDGTQATVISFSEASLEVSVPAVAASAGAAYGITVTNPDGRSVIFENAFTMAVPVITALNGGITGSGAVGSLFVIDGSDFGDLSAASSSDDYYVSFRDSSTNAVIANAPVNFAEGDWMNIFIVGTVPNVLAESTIYKVTVTTPSGTSASGNFMILASVSFSPSTILWSAASSLPVARQGFPTIVAPIGNSATYVYALGGNTSASNKASNASTVYFNLMNAVDGSLANAAWSSTTSLPEARGFSAAVLANGYNSLVNGTGNGNIYVLGGLDAAGSVTNTVYYASIGADGAIGAWANTTSLPQPLFSEGAAIFHGRIYVAGGNGSDGAPVKAVYSARLNSDGTLGDWQTLADLPTALAYHQLVSSAGYLYVLGGSGAASDPTTSAQGASLNSVNYNQINIRNGALVNTTAWATNSQSMTKGREKFSAVVAGSYVLVSGGLYNAWQQGSSEQSYSQIQSDGSMGSFNGATGTHTIAGSTGGYNFFNHSSAYFVDTSGKPHVLILGGQDDTGELHSGVWFQHE